MFASSPRCRLQPLALTLLLVACLAGHACGSCLSYGHSCWGAHGKRSGSPGSGDALLVSDGSSGPSPPLSSLTLSSSSSPSEPDPEALWVLSKLMATKGVVPNDKAGEEALSTDSKDFNIWQRLLDAKKERKSQGTVQAEEAEKTHRQSEGSSVPSESRFEGVLSLDGAQRMDEVERRNMLLSGEKSEKEDDGDDLAQIEDEEDPSAEDDEESDAEFGGRRKEGRRYRYKTQKYWANRRKNRRPYYHYYRW